MNNHEEHLDNFIQNLRNGNFYDAHKDLEYLWFPSRFDENDEVKLIKGFINASVSFELHKKGKIEPSKKVWNNYLKYRSLLYKIDSLYLNKYHQIARHLESIKYKKIS